MPVHNMKCIGGNEDTAQFFIIFALYLGGWSPSNPEIYDLWVPEMVWIIWESTKPLYSARI
jgi:hypothetical protein